MTTPRRISFPEVKTEVIPFDGGLNESVSSLEMKPGELILCKNYYITEGSTGGYVSLSGYERFDGQPAPSSIPIGVWSDNQPWLDTNPWDDEFENDFAREEARDLIGEVGGVACTGPVRGSFTFGGDVYAFRDKAAAPVVEAGLYKSTALGWVEVDTSADVLASGGKYSFSTYHYEESVGTVVMWSNGVDKARVFNGTTVTKIDNTGMDPNDKPIFILGTWDRVVLGYSGGSVQMSAVGSPLDWTALGTVEFQAGYEITSISSMLGDTIVVTGRDKISIIRRVDAADYSIEVFSDVVGAYPYTVQKLFDTLIFMSDMGVTTLQATQEFGDFGTASVSEKIKRTLLKYKDKITCSVVVRQLNQYRLYFSDGRFLVFSFYNKKLRGVTLCQYPNPVLTASEGKDSAGNPIMFFTSLQGFLYQADSGTSFDGAPIDTKLSTSYYHYKSPRHWKGFQQATIEISSIDEITFGVRPSFDYLSKGTIKAAEDFFDIMGAGSVYGEDLWGAVTSTWGGSETTNRVMYKFHGVGSNMSVSLYTLTAFNRAHTLQNLITDFSILGRQL